MLMADFSTCVKYRLPVKVVVIKNNTLAQIKWEQIVMLGNPEFGCDLLPIHFAQFARDCGGTGFTIDDPKNCPGPAIIEAVVDPFEPPMPSSIKPEQAMLFAKALARGEPDGSEIAQTILKDKIRQLI
jgi:pyruvate dehydrogenase (quinone)/pyruvate oxidase